MHGFAEAFEGELFGVGFDSAWIEALFVKMKDGIGEGFPGLFVEENSGDAVDDGFERSTFFIGNNGATGCHGFDGSKTEVFFVGVDESDGVCKEASTFGVGDSSNEGNVFASHGAKLFFLWTVAEDDEGNTKFVKCGDDEVVPLVGNETSTDEIGGFWCGADGEL